MGLEEPDYDTSPPRIIFPPNFILGTLSTAINNFEAEVLQKIDAGIGPQTWNDYKWFKITYQLESRLLETKIMAIWSGEFLDQ
jgi:hypothetical protein